MSKRLQILVDEREAVVFARAARREGVSFGEWVRRALRRQVQADRGPTPASRLAALDRALRVHAPTGDIDQMLAEIERGRDLR